MRASTLAIFSYIPLLSVGDKPSNLGSLYIIPSTYSIIKNLVPIILLSVSIAKILGRGISLVCTFAKNL